MPGSWSDYLELRTGDAPPPSPEGGDVRVYADVGGDLRAVQSDGTDAPIGGGGGLPSDWSTENPDRIVSTTATKFTVQNDEDGFEVDDQDGARLRVLQGEFDLLDVISADGNEMVGVGHIDSFVTVGDGSSPGTFSVSPNSFGAQGATPIVEISNTGARFYRAGQLKLAPSFGDAVPTLDIAGFAVAPALVVRHATDEVDESFLNAGDFALWFDQTDGAAKLMVKAKSEDGTVVTGSLSLT